MGYEGSFHLLNDNWQWICFEKVFISIPSINTCIYLEYWTTNVWVMFIKYTAQNDDSEWQLGLKKFEEIFWGNFTWLWNLSDFGLNFM